MKGFAHTVREFLIDESRVDAVRSKVSAVPPEKVRAGRSESSHVAGAGIDLSVFDIGVDRVHPEGLEVVRSRICSARSGIALSPTPERKVLIIVLSVHRDSGVQVSYVGKAARLSRFSTGLSEDREEDRRENCDNSDDHEEFDQGKT